MWGCAKSGFGTWIQRAVGAFTVLLVISILIRPRMSTVGYDQSVVDIGCVLLVGATLLVMPRLFRFASNHPGTTRGWDIAASVLIGAGSLCAALVSWGSAYNPTWDSERIKFDSTLKPSQFAEFSHIYYSRFPNNDVMMATARFARSVASTFGMSYQSVFVAINTASFLVTAIALYLTVRMIRGPRWGAAAVFPFIGLIGLSSWMSIPYTDMLGLWAPMTAVCFFVAGIRSSAWSRYLFLAASGVALGVGYEIKSTPIVGLVAVLVVLFVMFLARPRGPRRVLVGMTAAALIGVAVSAVAVGTWSRSAADVGQIVPGISRQPLAYAADGQLVQHAKVSGRTTYGAWDQAVDRATSDRSAGSQNRIAAHIIYSTVKKRGFLKEVAFEADKVQFNWGDGTFWAHGEGTDLRQPPVYHGVVANVVNSFSAPSGSLWRSRVDAANIVWLSILAIMGVGLVRSQYDPNELILALNVVGIGLFTIIFQGRSRYLIGHVPVVIALATCVLPALWTTRSNHPIQEHEELERIGSN